MQPHYKPLQLYARESRKSGRPVVELGVVRHAQPDRVTIATLGPTPQDDGLETFNPAYDFGWRLCG